MIVFQLSQVLTNRQLNNFLDSINNTHPEIEFTVEKETNESSIMSNIHDYRAEYLQKIY